MAAKSTLERRMRVLIRKMSARRMLWPSKKLGMVRQGEAWEKKQ